MSYYLKRYLRALRNHWRWTFLALVPATLYLVLATVLEVDYAVSQDFDAYAADTPVAAANSPMATLKLGRLVADPSLLFLDTTALAQLQNRLRLTGDYRPLLDEEALHQRVNETMSLAGRGEGALRLHYAGRDAELGRILVAYYGDRLLRRIADGANRTHGGAPPVGPSLQPAGALAVTATRTLWRATRLAPAALILLVSVLAALGLIAWLDISDPSFRSERQIARYLGVPVLGVLPDATPLVKTLPEA